MPPPHLECLEWRDLPDSLWGLTGALGAPLASPAWTDSNPAPTTGPSQTPADGSSPSPPDAARAAVTDAVFSQGTAPMNSNTAPTALLPSPDQSLAQVFDTPGLFSNPALPTATPAPAAPATPSGGGASSGGGPSGAPADAGAPAGATPAATTGQGTSPAADPNAGTGAVNPPVVTNPGPQTSVVGVAVSLRVQAGQADGHPLTFAFANLPPGLSGDANTGLVSGTVAAGADTASPYAATVTATDTQTNTSASQNFAWAVTPNAVTVTSPGDQSGREGDAVSFQVAAGESNGGTPTFSLSGAPAGVRIDPNTGVVSGTIAAGAATSGPYAVAVTATDGPVVDTQTFNWTVAPRINLTTVPDRSNLEGDAVSLQVQASSPDGNALTYSIAGQPPGVTVDPNAGLVSGTISAGAAVNGPYTATLRATDGTYSASQTVSWDVVPRISLATVPDQSNLEGDAVSLQVQAGSPHGNALTYTLTGAPGGVMIDPNTGSVSGTISAGAANTNSYTATLTATDGTYSASQTVNWTVAPRISLAVIADQSNLEGDAVSLQASASSPDEATLTYSITGQPTGVIVDPNTGLISGTVGAGAAAGGPYTVTLTATDGTYSASQAINWTVAPRINLAPIADQSDLEGDTISVPVTASCPDGAALTYALTGAPPGLNADPNTGLISGTVSPGAAVGGPYTATLTATDGTYSGSQRFGWAVAASNSSPVAEPALVDFAINDTLAHADDVGFIGKPLPVRVTLHAPGSQGSQSVVVSLAQPTAGGYTTSGKATILTDLSQTSGGSSSIALQLSDGQSQEIYVLPQQVSDQADDVVLLAYRAGEQPQQFGGQPAEQKGPIGTGTLSDIKVSLGSGDKPAKERTGLIYADTTPKAMIDLKKYRIPPRVRTNYWVQEVGALPAKAKIYVRILNQSFDNGKVVLSTPDGQVVGVNESDPGFLELTAADFIGGVYVGKISGAVRLGVGWGLRKGVAVQTAPGDAGKLVMVLLNKRDVNATEKDAGASSAGFTVAAIPIGVKMSNPQVLQGTDRSKPTDPDYDIRYGVAYTATYISDSGQVADLDKVLISEDVKILKKVNVAATFFKVHKTSGNRLGDQPFGPETDDHTLDLSVSKTKANGDPVTLADARAAAVDSVIKDIKAQKPGNAVVVQTFKFEDLRDLILGKKAAIDVPNSSFSIYYNFLERDGKYYMQVMKAGLENPSGVKPGEISKADSEKREIEIK